MKKLALSVAMAATLAGCQTMPVTSSNPNAELSRTGQPAMVSFGLQNTDFEYAANQAVMQFLESPFVTNPKQNRWVVQMGEVVNDTTYRIDTASMTSRMKMAMTRSGRFVFTGATGSERTNFVADSRQLSKSRMFDQKTVARQGTVIAPDLEMSGAIRQRTVVSADHKQQQMEYEFDFRVVERDTGLEIFQAFIPIEKLGPNKSFAW